MKNNKLAEYTFSPMNGVQGHCCKAQVFDAAEMSLCSIDSRYGEIEATKLAEFIANAFNTANKCGLLPSELLEQNATLLYALKRIESIYDWQEDAAGLIAHSTINQIEQ